MAGRGARLEVRRVKAGMPVGLFFNYYAGLGIIEFLNLFCGVY